MAVSVRWRAAIDKLPASEVRTPGSANDDDDFDGISARGLLWTLMIFKIATVAAIYWAARGSNEAGILLFVTTWPWLIIPAIVLFGWLAVHMRLRRVRARREALQRSEWMLDEHETIDTSRQSVDRDL